MAAPKYIRSIVSGNNNPSIEWFPVDVSQTINEGDWVQIDSSSRKLEVATAASTTLVGIAAAAITTGGAVTDADRIPVILARFAVIRMPFTAAGSKKTFAQTDLYSTKFDLSNKTTVDPDDTTGGMMQIVDYDNDALTVDVVCAGANQFLV